ncbi:MAG: hypothetical protein CMK32_16675 [Porticoccaceae bacterium]|nr:hypothetical protein [Porticoccaceae bacterium]
MLHQRDVDADEERLRTAVAALKDEQRRVFYERARNRLRDPDTYAALNWFFLAGLHHFYLGRWWLGLLDLGVFLLGVVLIVAGLVWPGIGLILCVSVLELWALFRAQIIVQDWNNRIYRSLLAEAQNE